MSTDAPIRITLEQEEDYSFRIRFDDTTIAELMTDEPEPLGKGEGPNPTRQAGKRPRCPLRRWSRCGAWAQRRHPWPAACRNP